MLDATVFKDKEFDLKRHVLVTSSLVLAALFLSLITEDLGIVLEIAGGCGAAALAYVLPAACYLKLAPNMTSKERLAARVCIAFGVAVTGIVLVTNILKVVVGS